MSDRYMELSASVTAPKKGPSATARGVIQGSATNRTWDLAGIECLRHMKKLPCLVVQGEGKKGEIEGGGATPT